MICWPSDCDRRSAMIRQMMSGVPPAACETMILIGLVGQVWALARPNGRSDSAISSARNKVVMICPPSMHPNTEQAGCVCANDLVLVGGGNARRSTHEFNRFHFAHRII